MPYWRLFYHFVWGTKQGEPLIESGWENSLHNVIAAKAAELEAMVYAVGGTDNHIHLVTSVPPKVALSAFIGQVKGNSSHWVNHDLNPGYLLGSRNTVWSRSEAGNWTWWCSMSRSSESTTHKERQFLCWNQLRHRKWAGLNPRPERAKPLRDWAISSP